jgi:prepilin-type N-terminal cleavage/methylation domain-containing protein
MRKKEKGFLLLELLIAVAIIAILASMVGMNLYRAKLIGEQKAAKDRVTAVYQLEMADATCQVNTPGQCGMLDGMLPVGTVNAGDYAYTFAGNAAQWTYTAAPTTSGLRTISINNSGALTVQ